MHPIFFDHNVIMLSQPYQNAGILSKRRYDKEYP